MSRADIQERARLLDQIDRLETLFGSRFHLDAKCGSCGGPLECDRDAICHRCTDKMEIERLQAIVDRLPKTADGVPIVPGDVLHFMDVSMQTVLCWQLPENPRGDEIAVANCCPFSGTYSTREAAEQARAT